MTTPEIYEKLSAPLPEAAIERTDKNVTKKGYDTTGYKYQYIVNRLNEVVGINGWGYELSPNIKEYQTTSRAGYPMFNVCVEVIGWLVIDGKETPRKTMSGGHASSNYADAKKGAITNAFKKTFALFGVGKQAYEATIDDDNTANDDGNGSISQANALPSVPAVVNSLRANSARTSTLGKCADCTSNLIPGKNGKPYCKPCYVKWAKMNKPQAPTQDQFPQEDPMNIPF